MAHAVGSKTVSLKIHIIKFFFSFANIGIDTQIIKYINIHKPNFNSRKTTHFVD